MSALVAARAVHYVAMAQAFGVLAFVVAVAPPASGTIDRKLASLLRWSVAAAIASWLAWLSLQAAGMTSMPIAAALAPATLARVVRNTSFGHAWLVRLALLVAVAALASRRRALDTAAAFAAAIAIATLAETGHAAATAGTERLIHIGADALHAIAAGAWLGALVPLAITLRATPAATAKSALARRFSVLGIACVATLSATGIVNAVYLVATWPALFGTTYGQLLLAKLALFAAMLALAASNRLRATPALAGSTVASASARIEHNAGVEAALGAGALAIVAALGVSVPAAHDDIRWPFAFRIAFEGARPSIVAAYPTTYARAPVGYDVAAIARGAPIYATHCARCHGDRGRGDTAAAAALSPRPATLAAPHVLEHRDGDLYWWISNGIAGTPMPAFAGALDERARWDVVQFVKALATAADLRDGIVERAPAAPQFTYQIGRGPQQSVRPRSAAATLLVLYSLPASRERLHSLSAALPDFARGRIRVVALPIEEAGATADVDAATERIAGDASAAVAAAYRRLARDVGHAEFLIDRDDRLRARWSGGAVLPPAQIVRDLGSLPPASAYPSEHDHGH